MKPLIKVSVAAALVSGITVAAAGANAAAPRGELLAQRWCGQCHALKPDQKSPNPDAPSFPAIAGEQSATDYSLHVFLRSTHATMPNLMLAPDDIDDLVNYILSFRANR